ncbi:uncharacterized protein G2W53_019045 [Senna tora]|uniref:Uncharacterized protein n=1 Tax=Senna tora TaxID=362788 RepID=A0A834TWA8_9FABA|nr:uncharacterized protein G2W53_019045 [Senna tora]
MEIVKHGVAEKLRKRRCFEKSGKLNCSSISRESYGRRLRSSSMVND